jgi:hypothetical protein
LRCAPGVGAIRRKEFGGIGSASEGSEDSEDESEGFHRVSSLFYEALSLSMTAI